MELTFTNNDGDWVAEFEVRADYNIHLERYAEGRFDIWQKTAGGKYELINETGYLGRRMVYDTDFTALVYPKTIKIISAINPTVCVITAVGGDENITILEPEVPEEDGEGYVLEYHWEFDMHEDNEYFGNPYLYGEMTGDFSSINEEIQEFAKKYGVGYDLDTEYAIWNVSEEVMLEKANITANGYRALTLSYYSGGGFDMRTTAADAFEPNPGGDGYINGALWNINFKHGMTPKA